MIQDTKCSCHYVWGLDRCYCDLWWQIGFVCSWGGHHAEPHTECHWLARRWVERATASSKDSAERTWNSHWDSWVGGRWSNPLTRVLGKTVDWYLSWFVGALRHCPRNAEWSKFANCLLRLLAVPRQVWLLLQTRRTNKFFPHGGAQIRSSLGTWKVWISSDKVICEYMWCFLLFFLQIAFALLCLAILRFQGQRLHAPKEHCATCQVTRCQQWKRCQIAASAISDR